MSWVRRLCATAAVFALGLMGCDSQRAAKASEPVDGWALAREQLLDGSSCYARSARLCVRDEAFVDAAINAALERRFEGVMPTTRSDVERVIASARSAYRDSMQSPTGLERVEDVVQAAYDDPAIDTTTIPGTVNADFGALPGELTVSGRVKEIRLHKSPLLEVHQWSSAEAGARIGAIVAEHPDAAVIRAELRIPRGSRKHLVFRYFPQRRQLVFNERGQRSLRVCEPVDNHEALTAGAVDLGECTVCARSASGEMSRWCPLDDPYLQKQRDAEREARRSR